MENGERPIPCFFPCPGTAPSCPAGPYGYVASIKGDEKYIHHFGDQPDEVFDLSEDPLEQRSLAGRRSETELGKQRQDLLAWHSGVNTGYGGG